MHRNAQNNSVVHSAEVDAIFKQVEAMDQQVFQQKGNLERAKIELQTGESELRKLGGYSRRTENGINWLNEMYNSHKRANENNEKKLQWVRNLLNAKIFIINQWLTDDEANEILGIDRTIGFDLNKYDSSCNKAFIAFLAMLETIHVFPVFHSKEIFIKFSRMTNAVLQRATRLIGKHNDLFREDQFDVLYNVLSLNEKQFEIFLNNKLSLNELEGLSDLQVEALARLKKFNVTNADIKQINFTGEGQITLMHDLLTNGETFVSIVNRSTPIPEKYFAFIKKGMTLSYLSKLDDNKLKVLSTLLQHYSRDQAKETLAGLSAKRRHLINEGHDVAGVIAGLTTKQCEVLRFAKENRLKLDHNDFINHPWLDDSVHILAIVSITRHGDSVANALQKIGSLLPHQREFWLPKLSTGKITADLLNYLCDYFLKKPWCNSNQHNEAIFNIMSYYRKKEPKYHHTLKAIIQAAAILENATSDQAAVIASAYDATIVRNTEEMIILRELQTYISRIKLTAVDDLSKVKPQTIFNINPKSGFHFFADSQAKNRIANYKLACDLRDGLFKGKDIHKLFSPKYINATRQKFKPSRGIHSNELNAVIKKARHIR